MDTPIERINIMVQAHKQLFDQNCIVVKTNPFSDLYQFIVWIIYSLDWGEIRTSFDDDMSTEKVVIDIHLNLEMQEGQEKYVFLTSRWVQHGGVISIENSYNNRILENVEFKMSSERYFTQATRVLKKHVRNSVYELLRE